MGAWNLMHLRSHSRATLGAAASLLPFFPGAIIGIPMGVWALILLRKGEVKAAFGQETTEVSIPPKVREFAVSAVGEVKAAFEREKAEFAKLRPKARRGESGEKPPEAPANRRQLGMPIAACVIGLVGIVFVAADLNLAARFSFGFVFVFFAIALGVMTIRRIENYRQQIVRTGIAVAGIILGAIAGMTLLGSLF